jgi:hypothetical protein
MPAGMRYRGRRVKRFGLRLALLALAVQALIPFLVAFQLRALAQSPEAAVLDAPLCLHDGSGQPAGGAPHQDCTAACPLCAALAAGSLIGPPPAGVAIPLVIGAEVPTTAPAPTLAGLVPSASYRSRAPPKA